MGTRGAWWALLVALGSPAVAADAPGGPQVVVTVPDGRLRPGGTALVEVATRVGDAAPALSSSVGPVRLVEPVGDGAWRYALQVPGDAHDVTVYALVDGRRVPFEVPVWVPPESSLDLPRRIEGVARGGEVVFLVTAEDVPDPDDLQVFVAEGRVVAVERAEGGLRVRMLPDDDPFPRHVQVGVRDLRHDERPAWAAIRMRARPSIPLDSEPGSRVTLMVGDRSYGPFNADANGRIDARVDQYPEERVATALFTDDLGNQTRTEIPLAVSVAPSLVAFPSSDLVPGGQPPILYLAGSQGSGFPWKGDAPTCRTAALDLSVRELSRGQWMVALPAPRAGEAEDLRVDCDLGGGEAIARVRVSVARGIPARLGLRVWPTELRSDFPFAEVRVVLEDHRGDRLDVSGVKLWADAGSVTHGSADGTQLEGEYAGEAAADRLEDVVRATWDPPVGSGPPDRVQLGWDGVPLAGRVSLRARVLDPRHRPLIGIPVRFDAGEDSEEAVTDETGVARARVQLPPGTGPVVLTAVAGAREARGAAPRGGGIRGWPDHDLVAQQRLTLSPGRVAGISVRVEPAVLRAAPGAVAWVYVNLEDRGGSPITDEAVRLSASEGTVSDPRPRPDGTLIAEYVPVDADHPRDVQITAETDTLRSTTVLEVAPRTVRMTLGAWAGAVSNLGGMTAPVFGIDGDLRVRGRLVGESLMLRLGGARYQFTRAFSVNGDSGEGAVVVYPVTAGVLLRRDRGRFGAWAGGGGILAFEDVSPRFEGREVGGGIAVTGGPALMGGAGVRALSGELLVTSQASWLPPAGGEFSFNGNNGGLALGLGYRLVF